MSELKPKTPTKDEFFKLYSIIQCLCSYVFNEYEVTDTLIKENKEIQNSNNELKYNETVTCTQNDMEKSQCTVKILDMKIDRTNKTGQIDNAALLRDTIRKNLIDIFKSLLTFC